MSITKNCIVTLDYSVTDNEGHLIDEGAQPIVYLHGGYEGIFEAIEADLEGKSLGDPFSVALTPSEAFGKFDENLVVMESLSDLPDDLEVGMMIEGYMPSNEEDSILYRVTEIKEDRALLDGNHPLAGLHLIFSGTISDIHPASEEEVKAFLANG